MEQPQEADPLGEMQSTLRGRILVEGAMITNRSRNASYGDPVYQMGVAGTIKDILRKAHRRQMTAAEWEALDMIVTKLARSVCGERPGLDTFMDGAVYFAIYGEAYKVHMDALDGSKLQDTGEA